MRQPCLQVKISVSKLIFPLFVPPLFLKASKSLFYNGKMAKDNSLTTVFGTQTIKLLVSALH